MPSNEFASSNLFGLTGKAAVITGASGGMASTVSKYLLDAGVEFLALMDIGQAGLNHTLKLLRINHPTVRIETFVCDISDAEVVRATMTKIREAAGVKLDILVNTAGFCENFSALDYPVDRMLKLLQVNLAGSMIVATEFARTVIQDLGIPEHQKSWELSKDKTTELNRPLQTTASIILIASMSGHIINHPQPQAPYNMSKAGVIHLAKSLASEWAPYGIRVNSLSPGYILTPLTKAILDKDPALKAEWEAGVPNGRMAEPDEFAGPIIFLASNASSYMTGSDMIVDGGYTVR